MSDTKIERGQWYHNTKGAELLIESVEKGQVYYIAWPNPRNDEGVRLRMSIEEFRVALGEHGATLTGGFLEFKRTDVKTQNR